MKLITPPTADEKALMNAIRPDNTNTELRYLLSFKDSEYVQKEIWRVHKDKVEFADIWVTYADEINIHEKAGMLEWILMLPKYDSMQSSVLMQCFDCVDFFDETISKEFIEIKEGEHIVPFKGKPSDGIHITEGRLHFDIDLKYSFINKKLCEPKIYRTSVSDFLLTEDVIEELKQYSHMSMHNVSLYLKSNEMYYSSYARAKAAEMCENKIILQHLLCDSDEQVRKAAMSALYKSDTDNPKEAIYKMLESDNPEIRAMGIKKLRELDGK